MSVSGPCTVLTRLHRKRIYWRWSRGSLRFLEAISIVCLSASSRPMRVIADITSWVQNLDHQFQPRFLRRLPQDSRLGGSSNRLATLRTRDSLCFDSLIKMPSSPEVTNPALLKYASVCVPKLLPILHHWISSNRRCYCE